MRWPFVPRAPGCRVPRGRLRCPPRRLCRRCRPPAPRRPPAPAAPARPRQNSPRIARRALGGAGALAYGHRGFRPTGLRRFAQTVHRGWPRRAPAPHAPLPIRAIHPSISSDRICAAMPAACAALPRPAATAGAWRSGALGDRQKRASPGLVSSAGRKVRRARHRHGDPRRQNCQRVGVGEASATVSAGDDGGSSPGTSLMVSDHLPVGGRPFGGRPP